MQIHLVIPRKNGVSSQSFSRALQPLLNQGMIHHSVFVFLTYNIYTIFSLLDRTELLTKLDSGARALRDTQL